MHATLPVLEDATVHYVIDTNGSTFVVQAFSTGLLSAFAHNPKIAVREFEGFAEFVRSGASLEQANLSLRIRAESLEVAEDSSMDSISQKDREEIHARMCKEVLETDSFPEIVYESSRITASGTAERYWAAVSGNLTLHGVSRSFPISAKVVLDGDSLRASGEFQLKQSDYKIKLVTAAGGAIRVKDDLKITFDVVARKKE